MNVDRLVRMMISELFIRSIVWHSCEHCIDDLWWFVAWAPTGFTRTASFKQVTNVVYMNDNDATTCIFRKRKVILIHQHMSKMWSQRPQCLTQSDSLLYRSNTTAERTRSRSSSPQPTRDGIPEAPTTMPRYGRSRSNSPPRYLGPRDSASGTWVDSVTNILEAA